MKLNMLIVSGLMLSVISLASVSGLLAQQQQNPTDTSQVNKKGAGIPNSGNTLYPNNGPEFPHSSFPVQSTDPGPLYKYNNVWAPLDSIPDPQKGSHAAPVPWP
jgi:hypothetical protein